MGRRAPPDPHRRRPGRAQGNERRGRLLGLHDARSETGATTPTELEALLAAHSTDRVVVGGLATDYCVKATALDATRLGYPTTVLAGAIRAVDLAAGDGDRALAEMAAAGVRILEEDEA